jgi:HAD superfamily hydrolase (TIGR01490 family)
MPALAFFDFDGTITTKDSMLLFLRFVRGNAFFTRGMLVFSARFIQMKLGLVSNKEAKEDLLRYFLKGYTEDFLYEEGRRFYQEILKYRLRQDALACIHAHKNAGHTCVLVTASLSFWTYAFAEAEGMVLISTLGEIKDGQFTGNIRGENCANEEKVRRIQALFPDFRHHRTYGYGDSSGDSQMLAVVDVPAYKPFH